MQKDLTPLTKQFDIDKGNVLLFFTAPWCGACRVMMPALLDAVEKAEKENLPVQIFKVNCDDKEQSAHVTRFGIRSIPCLIFLKEGKRIDYGDQSRDSFTLFKWIQKNSEK